MLQQIANSSDLVSFQTIADHLTQGLKDYSNPIDLKNIVEDAEAMICIGHACDRLSADLESVGTIDIMLALHQVKAVFYSSYDYYRQTPAQVTQTEDALGVIMTNRIHGLISYCNQETESYKED